MCKLKWTLLWFLPRCVVSTSSQENTGPPGRPSRPPDRPDALLQSLGEQVAAVPAVAAGGFLQRGLQVLAKLVLQQRGGQEAGGAQGRLFIYSFAVNLQFEHHFINSQRHIQAGLTVCVLEMRFMQYCTYSISGKSQTLHHSALCLCACPATCSLARACARSLLTQHHSLLMPLLSGRANGGEWTPLR